MATATELAHVYQKKTDKQHILDAPDTYIGAIDEDRLFGWVLENGHIVYKQHACIPGLLNIFNEALVNCRDHAVRLEDSARKGATNTMQVTKIRISVNSETGVITLINDGDGIDIARHPEHNIWIPEMIFGHLRTSTNYNKDEKRIVGGKNGFGVKLIFIYAKWGKIETVDHRRGLKYTQTFENNLDQINKPIVRKCTRAKPYTSVSWLPDYARFGTDGLSKDMIQLFEKRAYDIAAVTDKMVKVVLNGTQLKVRGFERYVDLYVGGKQDTKRLYERISDRWEYAVCISPHDEFVQVSFVNGICTSKGGRHVDYILRQILKGIAALIEKKKKVKVKPATIKEQLMLFVNCTIENPTFDSQTKDFMTTPVGKFGSRCQVSETFITKLAKLGVVETAVNLTEIKECKKAKTTDGKKTRRIFGIPKLTDANLAGGTKSATCTLILCEGDSAKAGVVSGLTREDRDVFGVFPLRGKPPNAKEISQKRLNENQEVANIKKILGLQTGKEYANLDEVHNSLRYGKVLFLTDQDLDGSHIKGLCMNLFHTQWPSLLALGSFLGSLSTPIIKARRANEEISFYTQLEYEQWKANCSNPKVWKIKYYKGLGTSTGREFKQYLRAKKQVIFRHGGASCDNALDLLFNKKRADDRKIWLANYRRDLCPSQTGDGCVSYTEFINKEMIHFSKYDCERSIASAIDGLKLCTRKILWSAFKRKLRTEIKVATVCRLCIGEGSLSPRRGFTEGCHY